MISVSGEYKCSDYDKIGIVRIVFLLQYKASIKAEAFHPRTLRSACLYDLGLADAIGASPNLVILLGPCVCIIYVIIMYIVYTSYRILVQHSIFAYYVLRTMYARHVAKMVSLLSAKYAIFEIGSCSRVCLSTLLWQTWPNLGCVVDK